MTVAEAVHSKIDNSIEYLLKKIEQDAISEYLGGFTVSQFTGLVNDYRLKYPQNPFITHEQVKAICLEHDLKIGPELAFIGGIPERNQKEVDAFVSPGEDLFNSKSLDGKLTEKSIISDLIKNFRGGLEISQGMGISDDPSEIMIVLRGQLEGYSPHRFVLPISDQIAIYYDRFVTTAQNYIYSDCCYLSAPMLQMNVILQDDELNTVLIPIDRNLCSISEIARREMNPFTGIYEVHSHVQAWILIRPIIETVHAALASKSYKQSRKVIAPGDFFNTSALKEVDGYQYALDQLAMTKSSVFVDDPIVLEPVKGGYLVVTKWGGESGLVDTNSN